MSGKSSKSYGQIFRSTSIVGGAQGLNYVIGMFRTKAVAVLLGPAGVGLIGLYQSAVNLVGVLAGLGIGSSGVREIAAAEGSEDPERIGLTVSVLRRACWITGFLGWGLTVALARPLSMWTFGTSEHRSALALLGGTLLLGAVSGGQSAILQGVRRIGDLARASILSVAIGTVLSVALYAWMGERGIVPVLLVSALANLGLSWWFARRVSVLQVYVPWSRVWPEARRMVALGLAFMWGTLLTSIIELATRALIIRQLGVEANGAYQAAWGLSGMFAGFILGAMGTDFYPRLTTVANTHQEVNRLVNEQTEVGALLGLPGLLATLTFAPWLMQAFYSEKFIHGAALLPWFVVGVFGRVISWPMGYVLVAKGASRLFAVTETIFAVLHIALIALLLQSKGLVGPSLAFAILYAAYSIGIGVVVNRMTGFQPSTSTVRIIAISICFIAAGFAAQYWLGSPANLLVGCVLTSAASLFTLRGVTQRMSPENRLLRRLLQLPGFKACCS